MAVGDSSKSGKAGRLFNRSALKLGKDFADHHDKPWFMRDTSPTSVGGFVSTWQGSNEKNTNNDETSSENSEIFKEERRQLNEKFKKSFLDEYRELIESDAEEDESTDKDWGWGLEEESSTDDEKSPLQQHLDLRIPRTAQQLATDRPRTQEVVPKSILCPRGKCSRHGHNRVQFSGSVMLMEKQNCVDTIMQTEFLDIVSIVEIPHFSYYSEETFEALWYTRAEVEQMKRDYFYWKRITRSGGTNPYAKNAPPPILQKLTSEGKSHNRRYLRHQNTIEAILREQQRQRKMCHTIYGSIIDSSGNRRSSCVLDPERLKDVYTRAGQTVYRKEQALERARRIREDLPRSFSSPKNQNQVYEDAEDLEWSPMDASCSSFWLDVSTPASHCVQDVFGILLSPFLEQKDRSFFLDVGNEMFIG